MILDRVNMPKDIKTLSIAELKVLATEMRELIIKKVNTIGGHMAPNLGIVEATIALHYVFDSPKDKIIFDVSHQCYPHKILTGRKEGFLNPENYLKYTGYTAPEESEHDIFKVGHTSTSISLATGVAKARDLKDEKGNVIALIGDGSLSGGEAYEGLNNAAVLDSNMIILVNDNDMSIAINQGGLYSNLKELRETKGTSSNNFFKTLGFDYIYVENGNDVEKLIETFEKVKDIDHPIVIHMQTLKGCGLLQAEQNKEKFHWVCPGILDEQSAVPCSVETYDSITTDFILEKAKVDKSVLAITPATPGATGFTQEFRSALGKQFTDVGIAEEHAIAYASAMAKCGAKPILAILSSFVQRTYDQLSQDLCLNNSPMTMLLYWGAISGADCTHLGCFDIPLISNIPNMVYLAPTCKEEYLAMLEYAMTQTQHPLAIRVPFGPVVSSGKKDDTDYSQLNKFKVEESGEKVAILGLGNFFKLAKEVKTELKAKLDIDATLINPKFITGLDEELLENLKENHSVIITLEDGVLDGGFGEKVARFYGNSDMKVLNYGATKDFTDRVPLDVLYERYRLKKELVAADVDKLL
ncbi:1-deoxy-D-xylulose-5-phosphate synthase [bacterium]|nr:1-deoxy-D-xylulose-5-phosphate synthase [bacterium]